MEQWSSRLGFVLAAASAAVGLGNIWRFPAVVGANGGGAYLVPYLLAAALFAVPLLVLEIGVGRDLRTDVVSAFRSVRPAFAGLGWLVSGLVVAILSYYLVLTGWVLAFLVGTAAGTGLTFDGFTATAWPVVAFALVAALTAAVVARGVRAGIERLATTVMPVVFVVMGGLALYGTTLSGFGAAADFFLRPDLSVLADPLVWSAAFGQVFFSLSVGQGIMLTYGSYLPGDADVVRSALYVTVADVAVAMLAGFVVFPVVFSFGGEPAVGTELAFVTLPRAFAAMPAPVGRAVGVAFFGLLFLAALTSAVSMLEVAVAAVQRATGRDRRDATLGTAAGVFVLGLPSALSYSAYSLTVGGVRVLDFLDESVGTLGLPVAAVCIAVAFTWFQSRETTLDRLGVPALYPLVKYVIPAVLVAVTAVKAFTNGPPWRLVTGVRAVPGWEVLLALLAVALGLYALARRRGRSRGRRRLD